MMQHIFRHVTVGILLFDLTRKSTLASFAQFSDRLLGDERRDGFLGLVVGNKSDLVDERQVSHEEGEAFANQIEFLYKEISSTQSLHELQEEIARRCHSADFGEQIVVLRKSARSGTSY